MDLYDVSHYNYIVMACIDADWGGAGCIPYMRNLVGHNDTYFIPIQIQGPGAHYSKVDCAFGEAFLLFLCFI